jgi:hypothetical protein
MLPYRENVNCLMLPVITHKREDYEKTRPVKRDLERKRFNLEKRKRFSFDRLIFVHSSILEASDVS